jgi:hypothetical protein
LDLCEVQLVKVAGAEFHVHELRTQLKKVGKVKVVVSWREADISALELELGEAERRPRGREEGERRRRAREDPERCLRAAVRTSFRWG